MSPENDLYPYGYCGMPCALCPYFHTKGTSRCEGCSCGGLFTGGCSIYKCLRNRAGELKHCVSCDEYPCKKHAGLKEFNCMDTKNVWLVTCVDIRAKGIDDWMNTYRAKSDYLRIALETYNNGRMKKYLCQLFIELPLEKIELLMARAERCSGDKKELANQFKELAKEIS